MNNRSFTLIELLVVIVIIGILAGVIMISTSSSIGKANITKLKVFEESVANNLAANMVSRWKLDESSGTNTKDSWGSYSGTLTSFNFDSNSGWTDANCVSNNCLRFDGVDDYFYFSNLAMTGFKTFEFWFNANAIDSASRDWTRNALFFDNGDNTLDNEFAIHLYNSNTISAGWGGAGYEYDLVYSGISTKTWYLVTITIGDANTFLYINGEQKNTDAAMMEIKNYVSVSSAPQFGHHPGTYPSFNGLIDDVRIYNAALSSFQIKQNYIAGLNSLLSQKSISKEDYNQRINELAYE